MRKLFTALFLLFMVFAYGAMVGQLFSGTAYAASGDGCKAKPSGNGGPDDADDGSGSGGGNGGPDDTDDDSGGGGGGGGSGPDDTSGGDF